MKLVSLFILSLLPCAAIAGERVAGTNSYVLKQDTWQLNTGTYWRQENNGTFDVTEGPIDSGFVQCIGAGFGSANGPNGTGICVFGFGEDTFTWSWKTNGVSPNTWLVVGATGKYQGMTGHGTARTRVESKHRAMIHRVTDWEGEVTLPE